MPPFNNSKRDSKKESLYCSYPNLKLHEEKILIVVKAAPLPSVKYKETVCTVGVTDNGKWIRLYPIPYRYLKPSQRFTKYQWIKVKIKKRKKEDDFRVDSYQPEIESIKPIGKPLSSRQGWEERKKFILPTKSLSLEKLKMKYENERISLGIFKPKKIKRLYIEKSEKEWSERHQRILNQLVLFGRQPKKLEKIPYSFSYEFTCNDKTCGAWHKLKIIDWEIYELYRKMKDRYSPAMDIVLEKVRQLWYNRMCGGDKDTHLIVGTVYPRKSFVILGVFWPPKQ